MTVTYRVLGQANPTANTPAALYTNGTAYGAVGSTLNVCNLGSTATLFSAWVRVGGASTSTSQYIAYNTPLVANDAISLTIGITMANSDILMVSSTSSYVAFTLFGSEFS
jgi:hypothetical protein